MSTERSPRPPFLWLDNGLFIVSVFSALALVVGVVVMFGAEAAGSGAIAGVGLGGLISAQLGRVLIFIARRVDTLVTGQEW